jgi:hypothetical protein
MAPIISILKAADNRLRGADKSGELLLAEIGLLAKFVYLRGYLNLLPFVPYGLRSPDIVADVTVMQYLYRVSCLFSSRHTQIPPVYVCDTGSAL